MKNLDNMTSLPKNCIPCETLQPLKSQELVDYLKHCPDWNIKEGKLHREFIFKDYKQTFSFVTKVAMLAEAQGHHPDIWFTWGKVRIELYTHTIKGLSENDFILAAKIGALD